MGNKIHRQKTSKFSCRYCTDRCFIQQKARQQDKFSTANFYFQAFCVKITTLKIVSHTISIRIFFIIEKKVLFHIFYKFAKKL